MAIYKLVQNTPLGPEEIRRLTTAYELTLKALASKIAATPSRNSSPKRYSRSAKPVLKTRRRFQSSRSSGLTLRRPPQ
jgi:hypothetical protein